jgi:hypothetical protein
LASITTLKTFGKNKRRVFYETESSLVMALTFLVFTMCAQPTDAQSGRGRQLRIAEKLAGEIPASTMIESPPKNPTPRTLQTGSSISGATRDSRSARLIYRDNASKTQKNDDYHMTKADKRAGWILLGVLAFYVVVGIANVRDF